MLFEKINKAFGNEEIIKDLSIDFPDGRITCILGNSGCGKTTLLNYVAECSKSVSYIFQEPRLLNWLNVIENVSVALNDDTETARYYLDIAGLSDSLYKYPCELSGGMRQRVSIARAFATEASVILMDEPFQSLDIALRESLRKHFIELWRQSKSTVLWVTHDITEALLSADIIYCVGSRPIRIKKTLTVKNPRSEDNLSAMSAEVSEIYRIMSDN